MFESQQQDEVNAFLDSSAEVKKLFHRHKELHAQVLDAELGVKPLDDLTLAAMKKEKLLAKDRLTYMWDHRRH